MNKTLRIHLHASVLINCLTIVAFVALTPRAALTRNLYPTVSLYGFIIAALANHAFPESLSALTHVVKAFYTHVLFAFVGVPIFWLPLIVSGFDLAPLLLGSHPRLRALAEGLGALARWLIIILGFVQLAERPWWLIAYGILTFVYFRERKARIARGQRQDYGWSHCAEHLAVWVYLYLVGAAYLDSKRVWTVVSAVLLLVGITAVAVGLFINVRLHRRLQTSLPPWIDPGVVPALLRKSRQNMLSVKLQNYVIKPFTPEITNRIVDWQEIEQRVAEVPIKETFDAMLGIFSGGAFIAGCLAQRLQIHEPVYVKSTYWSGLSLWRNAFRSFRYYIGKPVHARVTICGDAVPQLDGKRVLIVDDSTCTGATLRAVTRWCHMAGAKHVKTFALFCHPKHRTDYHSQVSRTPNVWPWGLEVD